MGIKDAVVKAIEKMDAWSSIVTGLGVAGKDKMGELTVKWTPMAQAESEQLYASNDVAKRIVNEVVDDGVREWIKFNHEDPKAVEEFTKVFDDLKIRQKMEEAWKSGRAFGGSGLLIVTNTKPDTWNLPLDPVKEGLIKSLVAFSKDELYSYETEDDVGSPRFGMPKVYQIQPISTSRETLIYVHHSRILRFDGEILPRRQFVQNNYWHDSVLNSRYEAIRNYNGAHLYATEAIADFSVSALKIKNLAELVAAGKSDKILARVNLVNMCKSIGRMLVLDAEEEFVNISRTVTGLPELVGGAENRLVMATGMPRTKILGDSPGGLGSQGKGEDRTWYDFVARQQEINLQDHLNYLVKMLELMPLGPTKGKEIEMSWEFNSLWQMSENEQADVYLKTAQADALYIDRQVLDPNAVSEKRFTADKFNQDLKLEEEEVEEMEAKAEDEAEAQKLAAEAAAIAAKKQPVLTPPQQRTREEV